MSSIQFARIIDPVCSCGRYVGKIQHEIEFEIIRRGKESSDDTDVIEILNEMGIKRICCRRTITVSPILRLVKTGPDFSIYLDESVITQDIERLKVNNPEPEF